MRARLRCTIRDVNWRIAGRGRVGMRGKLGELAMDATRSWGGGRTTTGAERAGAVRGAMDWEGSGTGGTGRTET